MKNKAIAAVVSLVLVLAISLPVSLSLSSGTDSKQSAAGTMAPAAQTASAGTGETAGTVEQSAPAEAAVPAAASKHADGCSDSCTGDGCLCGCHLFARIMACATLDEIWAIIDGATDAQLNALTEEQANLIDQLVASLNVAQAAVLPEEDDNPQIESEIIYPTVNCTDVAPFGEPVTGGQN